MRRFLIMSRGSRRFVVLAAAVLPVIVVLGGCDGGDHSGGLGGRVGTPTQSSSVNPLADVDGGVQNAAFYYQGRNNLDASEDLSALGSPGLVVTTPKADGTTAITAIHSVGAKAYRYVQFFWAPDDETYEGVSLADHPDWAFCRRGDTPVLGRVTKVGAHEEKWYFIDTNEAAARAAILAALKKLKLEGWDGVMFDRGGAALQYAADAAGNAVWDAASSCTQDAYQPGARFADAYVNVLGLAHEAGLQVMLNYGISPFDPVVPLRPKPSDSACQQHRWDQCSFVDDAWKNVDLVLDESVSFPKDQHWSRTFVANQRSEQDAKHGRRVLGLITTYTLGGAKNQTRARVFYEWARAKLFDIAMAVNTGDGGCQQSRSGVCNRYGTYPELVDAAFGRPSAKAPVSTSCVGTSNIHCLWTRSYANGLDVVNASARSRPGMRLRFAGHGCHYVFDVYRGAPLSGNRCVSHTRLDLPPWSGRPLLFSDKAF